MRPCVYLLEPVPCSSLSPLCVWPTINHPGNTELIDQHTKSYRPECLLQRHGNRRILFQRMKDAFCLRLILDSEAHGKSARFLVLVRWNVRSHQALTADIQAGMHDLAAPLRRHVLGCGRALVRKHGFDLRSEGLLVESEGRLAVAV